jgi:hypothetical protein
MIISLTDITPIPRYDGTPWTKAKIQEAPTPDTANADWVTLRTDTFTDPDVDPKIPKARDFTFDTTIDQGWYRITFVDATNHQMQPTVPIHNVPDVAVDYLPTLSEVGALLRTRTVDTAGNELGTFSSGTHPTGDEALALLNQAARDVALHVGKDVPEALIEDTKELVKYRAAMLIELSFFPEQVSAQRSPYAQYKDLYDTGLPVLVEAISDVEGDESDIEGVGAGMPHFSYPVDQGGLVGWKTVM